MFSWWTRRLVYAPRSQGLVVGDHNTVHQSSGRGAEWPIAVGVPPRTADCLQTRPHESAALRRACAPGLGGGTRVVVLSGLGGVGKTQLAAEHYREWRAGPGRTGLALWVNAGGRATVAEAYARAWALITGDAAVRENPEAAAADLLAWLETTDKAWMVVLDDVADPRDLQRLRPTGDGVVLITSRRDEAALHGAEAHLVDVGCFAPDQARGYLVGKLGRRPSALDDVDRLAADLGCLPLALAQAAAFVLDHDGETCRTYRDRFAERWRTLSELFPDDALADDYPRSVAVTWSISVDAADAMEPSGLARPLLELAAYLDPHGFPVDLLTSAASRQYVEGRLDDGEPDVFSRPLTTIRDCRDALSHLRRLSLVTVDPDPAGEARAVGVHALVQRATREHTPVPRAAARACADALEQNWEDGERRSFEFVRAVRDCAAPTIVHGGEALWEPEPHPLLVRAGDAWADAGLVEVARDWFGDLVGLGTARVGESDPLTLLSRRRHAEMCGRAGDPQGAAAALTEIVGDCERHLGPDATATLDARVELVEWSGELGAEREAVATLTELLDAYRDRLDPAHRRVLELRHRLADWTGRAGAAAAAVDALTGLLHDCRRLLGPDDELTGGVRHTLALWQVATADGGGAVAAYTDLLANRRRVAGPDHPNTLTTLHNLGVARANAGDHHGAVDAFAEALAERTRVLGPAHPDVAITRTWHAMSRLQTGETADALADLEAVLDDLRHRHGDDHPATVEAWSVLGMALAGAGDPAGAMDTLAAAADASTRVHGPDALSTLGIRWHLLGVRAATGADGAGIDEYTTLVDALVRVAGADHPQTSVARTDLAWLRGRAGEPDAARRELRSVYRDQCRTLGEEHPTTLSTALLVGLADAGLWTVPGLPAPDA